MAVYSNDGGRYFEGVIQLRPFNEEVYEWIKENIDKDASQFISKEEKVRGGLDIYVTSQRKLRSIGNKLKKKFNGEIKFTKSLYGVDKQRSKKIYRVTMLFRLKK